METFSRVWLIHCFVILVLPSMAFADGKPPDDSSSLEAYYRNKAVQAQLANDKAQAEHYSILADLFANTSHSSPENDSTEDDSFSLPQSVSIADRTAGPSTESQPGPSPTPATDQEPQVLAMPLEAAPSILNRVPVIAYRENKKNIDIVPLQDVIQPGQTRNAIQLELGTAVILEGQDFQRFLLIDPGIVEVTKVSRDQIMIKTMRRGGTFLHLWDTSGRSTLYVEAILPRALGGSGAAARARVEHAQPFKFVYSNDWNAYYSGDKNNDFERQSVNFLQFVGMEGETPYGVLDASATLRGFDDLSDVPTYTVGLSHIPLPGTSDLSVRGFDAVRYMTPLSMPGTRLRGIFADVNFMDDLWGVSVTHGRALPSFGLFGTGSGRRDLDIFADAYRLVLFPKDLDTQYSINYAHGYGDERAPHLTKRVYSIQGQQKIENVTVSAELARNTDSRNAVLSGLRYERGGLRSSLAFRNINREFTNTSHVPASQGEIGALWSTSTTSERLDTQTVVDVYRNRLFFNPEDDNAVNMDASTQFHTPLNSRMWNDLNAYYVHTPGEISPRRTLDLSDRLSFNFETWNLRQGTYFLGGIFQRSRFENSPLGEFDRTAAVTGFNLPLSNAVTWSASYEYSWVHELDSEEDFNPNVLMTSLIYSKQLNPKLSGTWGVDYRDEEGVQGLNSFLAGEDSVGGSMSLTYNPANDLNFFIDGRLRRVWAETERNISYYDFSLHLGMRLLLGSPIYWDPKGTVSGYVYKDVNEADAQHNPGEQGLAGSKVRVGDLEVTTDEDGWYFADVRAKRVTVDTVQESVPSGFVYTSPPQLTRTIMQGRYSIVDFGVNSQSAIYGVVFVDENGNLIADGPEALISRVRLVLDDGSEQWTDAQGAYYFRDLTPGPHTVTLDLNSIPIDMIPQVKVKTEIRVEEGGNSIFHIPLKVKEEQSNE